MNAVVEAPVFQAQIAITEESLRLARLCEGSVATATGYVIDSPEMATEAMEEIKVIRGRAKKLKELRDGFVAPAKQIMDNATALFTPGIKALEEAERLLKQRIATWDEQERARQAEERRKAAAAEAELRRKAEQEAAAARARAEAEAAEKRRQAAEEERKAREANDAEAAARAAALQAEAASIEEKAAEDVTTIHMEAAAAAPAVTVQEHKPKGYHTRDKWEGDVIDISKAIVAIASRPEFHSLLKIDQSALNRLAAATKGQAEIAGIEFVNRPVSVART